MQSENRNRSTNSSSRTRQSNQVSTKVKPSKKREKPKKPPAEIKRNRTFKIILNTVLCTFTLGISGGVIYNLTRYQELSDELNEINNSLAIEIKQQEDFDQEVQYLKSDEYIERIAREQLGMVKPNEILYINGS